MKKTYFLFLRSSPSVRDAVIELLRKVYIHGREGERNSSRGSGNFMVKIGLGLGLKEEEFHQSSGRGRGVLAAA